MNEILREWERYCEGDGNVDDCHFLGLFKSELADQELRRALRYFASSDQLEERLRRVLASGYLGDYAYLQRPPMKDVGKTSLLARAWLDEQARFCSEIGEADLRQLAQSAQIVFVDKAEYEKARFEDTPGGLIGDYMTDEVFMPLTDAPRTTFALIEAAYGIAADNCLAWYITQPLLKIKLDFSRYFDFWQSGGTGVLTEDRFLVLKGE